MKAFLSSYKTTLMGLMAAFAYAICSGAGACIVNGNLDPTCLKHLFFSACIAVFGIVAKDAKQVADTDTTKNTGPMLVLLLLIMLLPFFSQAQAGVIPPNGITGTININYNPQGNPGNTGDVQMSFNGAKASVSGFNFNPFSSTLLIDSLPATPVASYFNADTTTAASDTTLLKLNYSNVGRTTVGASMLNYVIVLPYTPVPITPYPQNNFFIDVQFTGKIQSLKVITTNGKTYTALYTITTIQPGQLLRFWSSSGTWQ